MSGELRVTTSHVRELAERQETSAHQIEAAAAAARGVGTSMMGNHGMICATSNLAVTMAEQARAAACSKMNVVSTGLSKKLGVAATRYDSADAGGAGKLSKEMHPR